MSRAFEVLDTRETPMGTLVLRRRLEPTLQVDVFEAILGDEHLMSNLFTVSETALADLALAELDGGNLGVLVGGLGLGYTARAAMRDPRVGSVVVVEALAPVIEWHTRGLVPMADALVDDDRCRLVEADFFEVIRRPDPTLVEPSRWDAVLLDIDHTPRHLLHPSHADLYEPSGLERVRRHLASGGVFALWSDDPPDDEFTAALADVFDHARAQVVEFPNFHTGGTSASTVYLARTAPPGSGDR